MKVSILVSIARQLEGEYVLVKGEKAHVSADKLFRYLRETDLPRTATVGDMPCVIEYGVIEDIEVDES